MTESSLDLDSVAAKALQHYGHGAQLAKAFEELGELITAIGRNYNGGRDAPVIDEIADVTIMLRQLRLIYGPDLVDRKIQFKLGRLISRMKEGT